MGLICPAFVAVYFYYFYKYVIKNETLKKITLGITIFSAIVAFCIYLDWMFWCISHLSGKWFRSAMEYIAG